MGNSIVLLHSCPDSRTITPTLYLVIALAALKNTTWVYESNSTLILVYDSTLSFHLKDNVGFLEGHPILF